MARPEKACDETGDADKFGKHGWSVLVVLVWCFMVLHGGFRAQACLRHAEGVLRMHPEPEFQFIVTKEVRRGCIDLWRFIQLHRSGRFWRNHRLSMSKTASHQNLKHQATTTNYD